MDREKVIKGLECCCEHIKGMNCDNCPYDEEQTEINQCTSALAYDALELLKEQEAEIEKLTRYINGFSRDAIPVVRCKDCKHRPTQTEPGKEGFTLDFPDAMCPCGCEDGYYSWYPKDDWFCAYGERAES